MGAGLSGARAQPLVVVAAAIVRHGRVLAAHRVAPSGWEFPGGKVEAGESEAAAIERECREELGVAVGAVRMLRAVRDARVELRLWHVELRHDAVLQLAEHDEARWFGPAELRDVDWLPLDHALLPAVTELLG